MKLVIGFITYNQDSAKYLAYFLPSLKKSLSFLPSNNYQILAFDNSDDNSNINRLAIEFFSYRENIEIKYISKDKNIGFGAAYNIMIRQAVKQKAEYFLLLNPDIVLQKKALSLLLKKIAEEKELVAVAPKILRWDFINNKYSKQIDSCGLVLRPGLKFKDLGQGEDDKGQFDKYKILAPSGAAGLFRLSLLSKIKQNDNYFSPEFFMYKEDCDLAYRLKLARLKTKLVPAAIFYHDRTAAFFGKNFFSFLKARFKKNKVVKEWSFYGQHVLFKKYFIKESLFSQIVILFRIIILFIFSLTFEQNNLKQYKKVLKT